MTRAPLIAAVGMALLAASVVSLGKHASLPARVPAPACLAQPAPDVTAAPADMIDGAEHPELIPDSIAYRLYFIMVAEPADASDRQRARQRALLKQAHLRDQDIQPAFEALATFRAQYDDLVARYNESVVAANQAGQQPDLATFISNLNDLVESTRSTMRSALGPELGARFEAHVQDEKTRMTIPKEAL